MSAMLFGVIALALINVVYKGIGPALLGDRGFPARVQGVVDAFPAALLAGLIVVQLLGEQVADADWTLLPGLVLATFAWVVRLPQLVCVALAIAATIAVRFVV